MATLKTAKHLTQTFRLYLAASYAQLGQAEEARAEVAEALKLDPDAAVERISSQEPYKNAADRDHFRDGMRKAGLPLCATAAHLARFPDMERLEECDQQGASG